MIGAISHSLNLTLTIVVFAVMGYRLLAGLRYAVGRDGRTLVGEIVRGIRWRHLWPVPLVLTVVVALALALVQLPGMDWGWWSALGGVGNPVTGSSTETAGTIWEWLIPLAFLTMLIPALPLFAHAEERMFRRGAQHWSTTRRGWMVFKFGLVHALIGIPLGVAVALSAGGAYFTAVYLRDFRRHGSERSATIDAARAHTAYNGVVLCIAVAVVVLDALT